MEIGALEGRMGAVAAVGKLVRAVWALARAQLPAAERAAAEASVYVGWLDEALARLAGRPLPLPEADTLVVVIGPEHAFCGGLPLACLRAIPAEGPLGIVGARLSAHVRSDPELEARVRFHLPGPGSPAALDETARALAAALLEAAPAGHTELIHASEVIGGPDGFARVTVLAGPREAAREVPETLSPLRDVIAAVAAEAVTGRLAVALADALRAEVKARLEASGHARKAAEDRYEALRQQWHQLRQELITREVGELAAARLATEDRAPGHH